MRLADDIRSHDLPMHLHSINAGVSWISPVAPYVRYGALGPARHAAAAPPHLDQTGQGVKYKPQG